MIVPLAFTANARRLGISSASGTACLGVVYTVTLVAGFLSLQSPGQPIGDPWFSILEILIVLMMPVMVALMVALHAWASPATKAFSLMALVFMGLVAGLTCSLHFVILTVSRQTAFAGLSWLPLFLSLQMALGRIRARHPCLGCVLPVVGAVRRASSQREPPRRIDSRAYDCQWCPRPRRTQWRHRGQHAAAQHRHRWLRGSVPRGDAADGYPFLSDDAARWRANISCRLALSLDREGATLSTPMEDPPKLDEVSPAAQISLALSLAIVRIYPPQGVVAKWLKAPVC